MAALLALLPAVGHDQLWCLYVADRMLAGVKLYGPQILESNPPLIMGLLLIPVSLSHLLHLPATVLFKAGVLLAEAASAVVSLRLLLRLCPRLSRATLWSLAFAFVTIFAAIPARDFGQRDHLLAILCLPYVLSAALDLSRSSHLPANAPPTHANTIAAARSSELAAAAGSNPALAGTGIKATATAPPSTFGTAPQGASPSDLKSTGSRIAPVVRLQDSSSPDLHHSSSPVSPASAPPPADDQAIGVSPAETRRTLSLSAGTLIGISAGIGIALKPHHLLIPVFLELTLLLRPAILRTRLFLPSRNNPLSDTHSQRTPFLTSLKRPEPWAILLTSLAYLLAIRLLTPAYLTDILPILRDTYWAIGNLTLPQLIAESPQLHLLLLTTAALTFLNHHQATAKLPHSPQNPGDPASLVSFHSSGSPDQPGKPNLRTLADLLLLAGLASTVAFYLQGTGWYYQQLPAVSFLSLSLWLNLIDLVTRHPLPTPAWLPRATAALSLLAVVLTAHFSGYPFTPDRSFPITSPDPTFFTSLPPNTPVAILSTAVDDTVPPLFRYHLLWAQRTNNLWILPAILRTEDPGSSSPAARPNHPILPARLAALDHDQHRFMVEDIARWHPALILIARCQDPAVHCQVLEDRHDNLLAWFARDPAFREAFSHYHYLRSSGPYDAYIPN